MSNEFSKINFKNIMLEAQKKIKELTDITKDDSKTSSGTKYEDVSIWLKNGSQSLGNIEQLANGNEQQQYSAMQNLANELCDLLTSLSSRESAKANKKVRKNDKDIEKNKETAERTSQNVSAILEGIMSDCTKSADAIKEALEKISELGGDKGKIKEEEAKLEEQLAIIEENKQILNDDSKDNNEKARALAAILGASEAIAQIVASVYEYQDLIEEQNSIVETNANTLAENSETASEEIKNGISKIKESLTNAGLLTEEQAQLAIEAGQKTVVGNTQDAIGQAMQQTPITVAEGVRQSMAGQDKISAGTTLMKGASEGFAKVTASIGEMGSYLTNFAQFGTGIGQFTEGAIDLLGQYDTIANPIIETIGSWKKVEETNTELQKYTQEYSQNALDVQAKATKDKTTGAFSSDSILNADSSKMKFTEFTFDNSEFRKAFGI